MKTKKHSFTIKSLNELYEINNIVFFENNLYERLSKHTHKYRIILNCDDYDYVTDRNLKRRLDRVFAK